MRYQYAGSRLMQVIQRHQSIEYRYDIDGRIVEKIDTLHPLPANQTRQAFRFITRLAYDRYGRVHTRTLPSGEQIRIRYGKASRPASIELLNRDGKISRPLATDIDIHPYTGLNAFTHGNGMRTTYRHGRRNGRLTTLTVTPTNTSKTTAAWHAIDPISKAHAEDIPAAVLPLYQQSIEYDIADRITAIKRTGGRHQQVHEERYGYDLFDRLNQADTPTEKARWNYDSVGNRLQSTREHQQQVLEYKPASNQLTSIEQDKAKTDYVYDAAGNPIRIGRRSYIYGSIGRLLQVRENDRILADYAYNAHGERVAKAIGTDGGKMTTYYLYQENKIDAEIDEQGTVRVQYLYIGDVPVAKIEYPPKRDDAADAHWIARIEAWLGLGKDEAASRIYAIHTNHLGAPQVATDHNRNVVWRADHTAFGKAAISINVLTLNLRLPGQYFDEESGLHYNYFRDYAPGTGRYLQSDPIGLAGGINTYSYVEGNPINFHDPLGLFVTGTYNVASETLVLTDTTTSATISGGFFSGGRPYGLPIPNGQYDILEQAAKQGFFRLEPVDTPYGDDIQNVTGRGLLRLHRLGPLGMSEGCITANENNTWKKVNDFILDTSSTDKVKVKSKSRNPFSPSTESLIRYGRITVINSPN